MNRGPLDMAIRAPARMPLRRHVYKNSSNVLQTFLFQLRGFVGLMTISILVSGSAIAQSGAAESQIRISLSQAERMAVAHNRTLEAERTLILQSKAKETTASLRPNPVFRLGYPFALDNRNRPCASVMLSFAA